MTPIPALPWSVNLEGMPSPRRSSRGKIESYEGQAPAIATAGDRLEDLVHETAARVLHGDAVVDIPCNHVAEECALADAAFAKDGESLLARVRQLCLSTLTEQGCR